MKKIFTISFLLQLPVLSLVAQPSSTEIYLVTISKNDSAIVFSEPLNITHHEGYDNQPEFSPDGKKIIYVSKPDTLQSDLYEYSIADSSTTRLTFTKESEYSPHFVPGKKGISVVRVTADGTQRLYSYSDSYEEGEEQLPGLDSIGYYSWISDSLLALVNLNNGLELVIYDYYSGQYVIPVKDIGRCLMKIPGENAVVFTKKSGSSIQLYRYSPDDDRAVEFVKGLDDVEDYAFAPGGKILAGKDGKLFVLDPAKGREWKLLADFSKTCGSFYRMAVSPDGSRIALVTYKGQRP